MTAPSWPARLLVINGILLLTMVAGLTFELLEHVFLFDHVTEVSAMAGVTAMCVLGLVWWLLHLLRQSERSRAAIEDSRRQLAGALEDMRAGQARLRALLDAIPLAVMTVDAHGRIHLANAPAARVLGGPDDTLVGLALDQLDLAEGVADAMMAADRSVLASGRLSTEELELGGRLYRFTRVPFGPDEGAGGAMVLAMAADITDQRHAEEALRGAQRLEALGQLTGGLAHDFNNILGIVMGNLELLSGMVGDESPARRRVQVALSAAERGADLTRRLLAFSRRKATQSCSCDIAGEISRSMEFIAPALPKNVAVTLELAPGLWRSEIDPPELGDALLNLALNAAHAMGDGGGRLTISGANAWVSDPSLGVPPGGYVVVAVTDTGCGIPPELLDKVFEPFFTTRAHGQGSGLGLSMVYGFARRCQGTIQIQSELGQGTTVRLYLPRCADGTVARDEQVSAPLLGCGETILVVEDEPGILKVAEDTLTELGYRVLVAPSATVALSLLDYQAVNLVFSDVVMPGPMNGLDLARELRRTRPGIKVLLTSGYIPETDDEPLLADVLAKPYRRDELARRIRHALDQE